MNEVIGGVLSASITGLLLLLGSRFVARQTREVGEQQVEVEQRKVDQAAFDRFVERYDADRNRAHEELEATRTELRESRNLFRLAIRYISELRNDMRTNNLTPRPLPQQLEDVAWDLFDDRPPSV